MLASATQQLQYPECACIVVQLSHNDEFAMSRRAKPRYSSLITIMSHNVNTSIHTYYCKIHEYWCASSLTKYLLRNYFTSYTNYTTLWNISCELSDFLRSPDLLKHISKRRHHPKTCSSMLAMGWQSQGSTGTNPCALKWMKRWEILGCSKVIPAVAFECQALSLLWLVHMERERSARRHRHIMTAGSRCMLGPGTHKHTLCFLNKSTSQALSNVTKNISLR